MKTGIYSSSNSAGGAARAAGRLHEALLESGADSLMKVGYRSDSGLNIRTPDSSWSVRSEKCRARMDQLIMRLQKTSNADKHSAARFSQVKAREINNSSFDIINLHWICNGFLSIEEIGRIRKPLVWTLHDMWPFAGAEHIVPLGEHSRWRDGYRMENRNPEDRGLDMDRWTWSRKKKMWTRPIQIVTPSRWLSESVQKSALMKDWPVRVIPNPVDTQLYRPYDQAQSRAYLDLPRDTKLILFSAPYGLSVKHKGWDLLETALKKIVSNTTDLHVVIVGQDEPEIPLKIEIPIHWMGYINDEISLAQLYSAVDVTVVPSRIENLPQVGTEAHSCGCPVVAFNVAGLPDVVEHRQSGYLANAFDIEDMANGIEWVLDDSDRRGVLSARARERAVKLWSKPVVASLYLDLFREVIARSEKKSS